MKISVSMKYELNGRTVEKTAEVENIDIDNFKLDHEGYLPDQTRLIQVIAGRLFNGINFEKPENT